MHKRQFLKEYYDNTPRRFPRFLRKKDLLIVTVAFNKPDLITLQNKLIHKYMRDSFNYVVCDNSNDDKISANLKRKCKLRRIRYVRLPSTKIVNPSSHPSLSHAYSLNWIVKNILPLCYCKYLVVIDHDIFPINYYSFLDKIKDQDFYGVRDTKKRGWYLWPGFTAINAQKFTNKINFLPIDGMDTGGSMWTSIYSKIDNRKLKFATKQNRAIGNGSNKQRDVYQVIDKSWLHLVNGSNWANLKSTQKKDNLLSTIKDGSVKI